VDGLGLLDDEAVLDEAADVLPRVGVGDLVDLVRVHPDFVPATFHDGCGKPLLQTQSGATHFGLVIFPLFCMKFL